MVAASTALAAGCGPGDDPSTTSKADCAPFAIYDGHRGSTVTIYGSIRDAEQDSMIRAWKDFVTCTGIDIQYEGTGEFEAQLQVRVNGGNAPDLALVPQPGLLATLARSKKLKPAPSDVADTARRYWSREWLTYSTVDGTLYAAPHGSSVKSLVWYSPAFFRDKGLTVPTTWAELTALSDRIAAGGIKPWCAGIESGDATGWPATDWVEDVLLRTAGTDVYDQWVEHRIPFTDPRVIEAMDRAGSILRNDKYVNGGFGGTRSIATTAFQEAGRPILNKKCAMHRQASFYAAQWPNGTRVGPDGDIHAFYLPATNATGVRPVLVAGEFTVAFADRPEVRMVQRYLASPEYANSRVKQGSWISANKGVRMENIASPVDRLAAEILQDPNAVVRFDGSDLMPAKVGAGTFWRGMTDWINGKDTRSTAEFIENSWR